MDTQLISPYYKKYPPQNPNKTTLFPAKGGGMKRSFLSVRVQKSIKGIPITVTITVRISPMLSTQRAGCCFYLLWVCMPSAWLDQMTQAPTKGRDSTLAAVALELLFYHH